MLCEILKPEQRLTLSGEGHRNPAKWVIKIPDCDTHASVDLDTGSHGLNHGHLALMRVGSMEDIRRLTSW